MRLMLLGALLLAATGLAPPRPAAAAVDMFRVAGIPVDATAASAVAAREQAIASGEREGLRQLLRRLTLPEDAAHLPPVEGLRTDDYVQSYEVAQEKLGPTRYIATLNVSYVPDQVRTLLRGANVPFLDRRPDPVLLLPVLETEQGPDIWGDANPWRAAWNAGAATSQLVELRLPLGDAGDVSSVTPASLSDPGALSALAQRYGAQLTVTADAKPRPAASGPPAVALTVTAVGHARPAVPARDRDRPAGRGPDGPARPGGAANGRGGRARDQAAPHRARHATLHDPGRRATCRPFLVGADKADARRGARGALGAGRQLRSARGDGLDRLRGRPRRPDRGDAAGRLGARRGEWRMAVATSGRPRGVAGAALRVAGYALTATWHNTANLLTLGRLASIPPLLLMLVDGAFASAFYLFLAAAASDALDGFLAKRFTGVTMVGAVLDPVADKLLMTGLFGTLAWLGALPAWLFVLTLVRDLLIVAGVIALRRLIAGFRVAPHMLGKLCTCAQLCLTGAALGGLSLLPPLADLVPVLVLATAALTVASAVLYLVRALRLVASRPVTS